MEINEKNKLLVGLLVISILLIEGVMWGYVFGQTSTEMREISSTLNLFNIANPNVLAFYNIPTKDIVLFSDRLNFLQDFDISYFHEKCHYYWYAYLNENQKNVYKNIYLNATYFVSDYAASDSHEDFASTCSVYILERLYNNRNPQIDINRLVFFNNLDNLYSRTIPYTPYNSIMFFEAEHHD